MLVKATETENKIFFPTNFSLAKGKGGNLLKKKGYCFIYSFHFCHWEWTINTILIQHTYWNLTSNVPPGPGIFLGEALTYYCLLQKWSGRKQYPARIHNISSLAKTKQKVHFLWNLLRTLSPNLSPRNKFSHSLLHSLWWQRAGRHSSRWKWNLGGAM